MARLYFTREDTTGINYLDPAPAAQTLSFATGTGNLSISGSNSVSLDGRYSLLEHTHPISDIVGLQDDLDDKLSISQTITSGYGIIASPDFSNPVSIEVNTSVLDSRYLRKDVDDDNGVFGLTLGELTTEVATINSTLNLLSLGTGSIADNFLTISATGEVQSIPLTIPSSTFNVGNEEGDTQFAIDGGDTWSFAGGGDTTLAFNPVTKLITITSIPGSGTGGVLVAFNGRDVPNVVPTIGDYNTDLVPELGGATNQYFTQARVRTTPLTGFTVGANSTILATDTILQGFGKAQGQINARALSATTIEVAGSSGNIIVSGGAQTLAANRTWTVNLAASGITPGTYPKVTIDTYGRATAGAALVAADIPNLAASKITSGTFAVARLGTGTPVAGTYVDGATGAWTALPSAPTVNNGTLTLATSGIATGSATFTANQSSGSTFTVTVPATNIAQGTRTATTVPVTSSTGTTATLAIATTTLAGVMSAADKIKLDGLNGSSYVPITRIVTGGNGLTGGGSLNNDLTIDIGTPQSVTLISGNTTTSDSHSHAFAPGGTTAQYIRGDGTLATMPTIPGNQTLTYTAPGNVGITGGNSVSINSLVRSQYQDFVANTEAFSSGLWPMYNTTGSVGYPTNTGQGIVSKRNNASAGDQLGSFALWTNASSTGKLYLNLGTGTTWQGWFPLATEDWVATQIPAAQTLFLDPTISAGRIGISAGNAVNLQSISYTTSTDANELLNPGLYPIYHIAGTNYPSTGGAGIRRQRSTGSALGSFEFWTSNGSTDTIYMRKGIGATTFGDWKIIADRAWVSSILPGSQTLSLGAFGTPTAGEISISGGNTIIPNTLIVYPRQDATEKASRSSLTPFQNSAGSTGYPDELGGGILYNRTSSSTNNSGFTLWRGVGATETLYINFISGNNVYSPWRILATREWATDQFVGLTGNQTIAGTKSFTGQILAASGNVTTPGISFSADPNTGWWNSTDMLRASTGGVERFSISNTNIGLAVPVYAISGTAAAPSYTFGADTNTGLYSPGGGSIAITNDGVLSTVFRVANIETSVPFLAAVGSASAPGLSFSGDTDTGLYRSGADVLNIATGGVARLAIGSTAITSTLPIIVPSGGLKTSLTGNATVFRNNASSIDNATIIAATGTGTSSNDVYIRPNGDLLSTGQTRFNSNGTVGNSTAPINADNFTNKLYVDTNFIPISRAITLTNGTGITITGGTQTLAANRTWTITNSAPNATHTGDVTGSTVLTIATSAVTTTKIADSTVTLPKLQNVSSGILLGRYTTGTGVIQGIVLGTNLTLTTGGTLNATDTNTTYSGSTSITLSGTSFQRAALTGDVTSPANSNVLTIAANAVETVHILNSAVTLAKIQSVGTGTLVGRGAAGTGVLQSITLGANLSLNTSGVLSATNTNTTYTGSGHTLLTGTVFSTRLLANTWLTDSAAANRLLVSNNTPANDMIFSLGQATGRFSWRSAGGTTTTTLSASGEFFTASTITTNGDVIAFASSDARLKDNISPIVTPLDRLMALGGYTFNWNSKQDIYLTGSKDYGVIAQEVESVFPEMVTTRDNGYKAVKYEKLIPVLIESIKELKRRLEALEYGVSK